MRMMKRSLVLPVAGLLCAILSGPVLAFDMNDVIARAQALAEKPFQPPVAPPQSLMDFNYDQYRDIRFKPEKTWWPSSKPHFDVQLLHAGSIFNTPVKLHVYDREGLREYPYRTEDFDFGKNAIPEDLPEDLGFAGFRIRYPINKPDIQDEVIVFSGASYFRAVSKGTLYGLSARGLAIDTALSSGEEFPIFREFWLERPAAGASAMRLYALLDSKRIVGAYRYSIYPGETTRIKVESTLIARQKIDEVGIAPLTSMFFIGENTLRPANEWRPEIHDSDGLLLENGDGEFVWRALENKKDLRLSYFSLENPGGFGLLQRDRAFSSYEDLETFQERRPSAWVKPIGNWGKGRVKLIEIPTTNEYNDNIVAYWLSNEPLKPGEKRAFNYWLNWNETGPAEGKDLALVAATRLATDEKNKTRQFVVDFEGGEVQKLLEDGQLQAEIWTDNNSRLENYHFSNNPVIGGVRLTVNLSKENLKRSELRIRLVREGMAVSETWTYLLEA